MYVHDDNTHVMIIIIVSSLYSITVLCMVYDDSVMPRLEMIANSFKRKWHHETCNFSIIITTSGSSRGDDLI